MHLRLLTTLLIAAVAPCHSSIIAEAARRLVLVGGALDDNHTEIYSIMVTAAGTGADGVSINSCLMSLSNNFIPLFLLAYCA